MQRSAALRALERLELHLYRDAAAVACVTRSFMANLTARGVDPDKLHYIPNGIVPDFWASGERTTARRALDIADDEALVSYVGTVGMAHGLETVVDAASRLRERAPKVRILVAGDGAELESVRALAAGRGVSNIMFSGLVPHDGVPSLLAASDVMLVTLKKADVFTTVLPSKMFEAMAARRPVVMSVGGEARSVLERSGGGVAVPAGDAVALADAIASLAADAGRREALGAAGGAFVAREFNRRAWAARYEELLNAVSCRGTASLRTIARTDRKGVTT
jgi:glycosyltransferase involved in cell wall biosynthesis